jgi:hypothetical protein
MARTGEASAVVVKEHEDSLGVMEIRRVIGHGFS